MGASSQQLLLDIIGFDYGQGAGPSFSEGMKGVWMRFFRSLFLKKKTITLPSSTENVLFS